MTRHARVSVVPATCTATPAYRPPVSCACSTRRRRGHATARRASSSAGATARLPTACPTSSPSCKTSCTRRDSNCWTRRGGPTRSGARLPRSKTPTSIKAAPPVSEGMSVAAARTWSYLLCCGAISLCSCIMWTNKGMVQIRVDSSGAAGAAATREFPIHLARTVNTFPGAK